MTTSRSAAVAVLVVLFLIVVVAISSLSGNWPEHYSVGYQIAPHYLGTSTWAGTPYVLTPYSETDRPCKSKGTFQAKVPNLVYTPPPTSDLRGGHPNWWTPDGGTYGLPPAVNRPDFWAGDATVHTYLARDPVPPLCDPAAVAAGRRRLTPEEWTAKWRYYGGPKGWNMSPYY